MAPWRRKGKIGREKVQRKRKDSPNSVEGGKNPTVTDQENVQMEVKRSHEGKVPTGEVPKIQEGPNSPCCRQKQPWSGVPCKGKGGKKKRVGRISNNQSMGA